MVGPPPGRIGRAPRVRTPGARVLRLPNYTDSVATTDGRRHAPTAVSRAIGRSVGNREVAAELVVSVKTVEFHLRNAFHKLGVSSRTQLPARMSEALTL
jgi:Bacterial regulatory proteins, luxR family